jgi:predicted nuclease of predicted toxin-antitoxin system
MGPFSAELLLDQGLPRDTAVDIRARGLRCTHVGEVGMHAASDTDIVRWAWERNAVIVTLDSDFHAILAVSRASGTEIKDPTLSSCGY